MKAWSFWEPRETHLAYGYIDLCFETLRRHAGSFEFILLNRSNLVEYTDFDYSIFDGGSLATLGNFLRLDILYRHGGFWLDSDSLVLSSYERLWDMKTENFATFGLPGPKSRKLGGYMMADQYNALCYEWREDAIQKINSGVDLTKRGKFHFQTMNAMLRRHPHEVFDERLVMPILPDSNKWKVLLSETAPVEKYNNSVIVHLANSYLRHDPIVNLTADRLLESNTLLGRLFCKALCE